MSNESQSALNSIHQLFKQMLKDRKSIQKVVESRVQRTVCATGKYYSVLPYEAERQREVKGTPVPCIDKPRNSYSFMFDEFGRLVSYKGFDGRGKQLAECFVDYSGDEAVARYYFFGERVQAARITNLHFKNNIPVQAITLASSSEVKIESYKFGKDKRIAEIKVREGTLKSDEWNVYTYTFNYKSVQRCEVTLDGKGAFSFDPSQVANSALDASKPKSEEVDSAVKKMVELLSDSIYSLVLKAKFNPPAFGIAINYNTDPCSGVIPAIGIGEANGNSAKFRSSAAFSEKNEEMLNPANFRLFATEKLQIKGKKILDLDIKIQQFARDGAKVDNREIAIAVARELNSRDWSQIETTDVFLVYAVDDDMADLTKNIKAIRR